MTTYAYSPATGELIRTDNVAGWMGTTEAPPPEFDPVTSGCFWRGDRWEIVESVPAPIVYRDLTTLEFLELFTDAEQVAVVSATMASPVVKLWYDKMLAAMNITLSDPRAEAGLDALVAVGLLTAERKAAIVEAMK